MLGGVIADAWRKRHPAGRVHVAIAAAILSGAVRLLAIYARRVVSHFYIACFLGLLCLTMWLGPVMASGQDLVLPRMRGTATALQFLGVNLIGLGLGPYMVGLVSDVTGDLRLAMLSAARPDPGDGDAVRLRRAAAAAGRGDIARSRPRRRRGDLTSVIA